MVFDERKQKMAAETLETRKKILDMLRTKKITFRDMLELPDASPEYKMVNRFTAVSVLSNMDGWNKVAAHRALVSYGIQPGTKMQTIKKRSDYVDILTHLCSNSATTWQQRVAAPTGWPWFGNMLATLAQLDEKQLPKEVIAATRYLTDDERAHAQSPYVEDMQDPSEDTKKYDDSLDDLFGDSLDEDAARTEEFFSTESNTGDDFLDDLLGG